VKTYIPSITGGVVALTIIEDREEQFKKAAPLIFVTLLGIVMAVKEEQKWKA
jgi:hypothetical protein